MSDVTHEFVQVTPEMAAEWLASNAGNRPLRPRRVDALVRSMKSGLWTASNDDICFSPEGRLLNGQHRLSAVTIAREPVQMGVKRGVPEEAFRNMDTGTGRTAGDLFSIGGEKNPGQLATVARLFFNVERFMAHETKDLQNYTATVAEADETLLAHPGLRDSTDRAVLTNRGLKMPVGVLGVAHYLIVKAGNDSLIVDYFFGMLERPAMEPADSAVHGLRARTQRERDSKIRPGLDEQLYRVLKAWNNWVERTPVKRVAGRARGDFIIPKIAIAPNDRIPREQSQAS